MQLVRGFGANCSASRHPYLTICAVSGSGRDPLCSLATLAIRRGALRLAPASNGTSKSGGRRIFPCIASVAIHARARVFTGTADADSTLRASTIAGGALATAPARSVCRRCLDAISDGPRKQRWAQSGWLPDIETRRSDRLSLPASRIRALAVRAGLRGHRHHYQGIALMNA